MRIIVATGALLLAGCAQTTNFHTKDVGLMVDKSITDIDEEKKFVYLEKSAFNQRPVGVITLVHKEPPSGALMMPMSAIFNGPVDDLIKSTAAKIGYSVRKYGERPGAPALVAVNRHNDTAYGIMEEGLLQAHGLVRITIDQRHKSITVRYKRPERSPVAHIDDTRLY
nr:DotD/TraH family lipoprotein [Brucella anthropi]